MWHSTDNGYTEHISLPQHLLFKMSTSLRGGHTYCAGAGLLGGSTPVSYQMHYQTLRRLLHKPPFLPLFALGFVIRSAGVWQHLSPVTKFRAGCRYAMARMPADPGQAVVNTKPSLPRCPRSGMDVYDNPDDLAPCWPAIREGRPSIQGRRHRATSLATRGWRSQAVYLLIYPQPFLAVLPRQGLDPGGLLILALKMSVYVVPCPAPP
ncbi:hypothetical protein GGR56DRAFT_133099 [Xylariaceae sp. FL0804]|nr:hypothetical protein GGR56DRAFT_133099 [Xylariaceae sp. FL0804]